VDQGTVPWPDEDSERAAGEPFDPRALDIKRGKGPWQGEVRLHANRHGVVVTSSYSGLIAGFDPRTLAPAWAFRVPVQSETAIHAIALDGGALVVLCIEGKHAAVLRADREGAVKAQRAKLGRDLAWGLRAAPGRRRHAVVCNASTAPRSTSWAWPSWPPAGDDLAVRRRRRLIAHASTPTVPPTWWRSAIPRRRPQADPTGWCAAADTMRGPDGDAEPAVAQARHAGGTGAPLGPRRSASPAAGVWTCAPGAGSTSPVGDQQGRAGAGAVDRAVGSGDRRRLFEAVPRSPADHRHSSAPRHHAARRARRSPLEPAYIAPPAAPGRQGRPPDPVSQVAIRCAASPPGAPDGAHRAGGQRSNTGSAMNGRTISVA
jgi:hypothetical protein